MIAFVQATPWSGGANVLKTARIDGAAEREVARIPGAIGERIALAPADGRIAVVADLHGVGMPGAYLEEGTLDVRDAATGTSVLTRPIRALERGLAFLPDGRLAFVALLPREVLPVPDLGDGFGREGQAFADWPRVPAVLLLDVGTGETRAVTAGFDPVASTDGRRILVADLAGNFRLVDVATGRAEPADWPGRWGRAIALVAFDNDGALVVHQGLPTEGAPVIRSPYGSFRAGLQTPPIKASEIGTSRHATLVAAFDPRHDVSFGGAGDGI